MNNRILLIDLSAILHAVKFSLGKHKLSHKEKSTFIIYGFFLKLNFLMKKSKADLIVFATDSISSKRKEIYSTYKAKRQQKTKEIRALDKLAYPQFEEIINFTIPKLGFRNVFGDEGLEADDIIGSICKKYKNSQIAICTSDHDMYQLLTDNVCIFNIKNNSWYTIKSFRKEFGIEPKMWKRIKAIGGCSSDNVKGVPIPKSDPSKKQMHVAEKGALNYIKGQMKPTTKAYQAIKSGKGRNVIKRNKRLVILPFHGTPQYQIRSDAVSKIRLKNVATKYGFKSILMDLENWTRILKGWS